jgi:hypothetical protein
MTRKWKWIIGVSLVAVLVVAGVAFAAWTGTGTGSGRARALTVQAATVNPVDGVADLYPGFTGGKVYFTIQNPNPYAITFTAMTPGTVTVDAGHASCPAASITVAPATGLSLVAPANTTTATLSISNAVSMAASAPDACQGASFDIQLTLNGTQS